MVGALGVTADGTKVPLGVVEGSTENATHLVDVCLGLLCPLELVIAIVEHDELFQFVVLAMAEGLVHPSRQLARRQRNRQDSPSP